MGFVQAYKMAIKSILSNKVRAFLTMLGVIIGVGSVIAAVAFAQGSTKSITDSIQSLGSNMLIVSIRQRPGNAKVDYNSLLQFYEKNKKYIELIAPQNSGNVTVKSGIKSYQTALLGTTPPMEEIQSIYPSIGRFITDDDVNNRKNVAVIGSRVSKELFENQNPIGLEIKINGQMFTVVGLLTEKDAGQQNSNDDQVVIPITTAQRLLKNNSINNFVLKAITQDDVETVRVKTVDYLESIFKSNSINDNANNDNQPFSVITQAQMMSMLDTVTGIMIAVLGGIATISLVVGGIGIMNIMLVSVTERTREIGIRKAIGAKKKNILSQFLIEALVVTGIGGVMGVLFGMAIIKFIIGGLGIVPEVYSFTWIVVSFSISLLVGVVFGIFPAYKASKLNPIEALRFE